MCLSSKHTHIHINVIRYRNTTCRAERLAAHPVQHPSKHARQIDAAKLAVARARATRWSSLGPNPRVNTIKH